MFACVICNVCVSLLFSFSLKLNCTIINYNIIDKCIPYIGTAYIIIHTFQCLSVQEDAHFDVFPRWSSVAVSGLKLKDVARNWTHSYYSFFPFVKCAKLSKLYVPRWSKPYDLTMSNNSATFPSQDFIFCYIQSKVGEECNWHYIRCGSLRRRYYSLLHRISHLFWSLEITV
jgi:hypothetical protein